MVHPDYVIGTVALVVILALIPAKILIERAEIRHLQKQAAKRLQAVLAPKKIPPPKMSDEKFSELLTQLCEYKGLHLEYPLLPSRNIPVHLRHDAPYQITKVILPMETDRQKWN